MNEWGIRSFIGLRGYTRAYRALGELVAGTSIDCVHAARCLPEGWLAWLLKKRYRLPYVCYVHGEDVESAFQSREHRWMVRRVFAGAEFIIANSKNSAALLRERWKLADDKIRIAHPGADTSRFVPAEASDAVREALGWKDRTVVLTVGRLQTRKGQDQMIRALPRIRLSVPNILYSIVGDGDDRARLKDLVQETDTTNLVQFRGEPADEELVRCYQQCDLFVLPNRQVGRDIEGFGMVLVEAQACGKPVIAGASGGTAETMQVGLTGRIVDCADVENLATAVTVLLADTAERSRMALAARRWAVERFDWESLAGQATAMFQMVRCKT
jgi:phosphatidyl-myo-inositol dimannoside synthase